MHRMHLNVLQPTAVYATPPPPHPNPKSDIMPQKLYTNICTQYFTNDILSRHNVFLSHDFSQQIVKGMSIF